MMGEEASSGSQKDIHVLTGRDEEEKKKLSKLQL